MIANGTALEINICFFCVFGGYCRVYWQGGLHCRWRLVLFAGLAGCWPVRRCMTLNSLCYETRPTKFRKLMEKYRRKDETREKSHVGVDIVVDLVSPEHHSAPTKTKVDQELVDSPFARSEDDSVSGTDVVPPPPVGNAASCVTSKLTAGAQSEDDSEAEAGTGTSGDDYGSADEEETWDDVLARLLARVEPLSARVRSALKAWANGQECDVVWSAFCGGNPVCN
jgi:hypothetical protein